MLPKIMPISKIVHLPILDKDVRVYAFKIMEEKILLLNKNSTKADLEDALIELIQSKTENIDVRKLTIPDIIVLFINIIDISRGAKKHFTYKCTNKIEDKPCNTIIDIDVDMKNYKITNIQNKDTNKLIKINDTISCELTYPTYEKIQSLNKYEDDSEYITRLYSTLICAIYENDDVYTGYTEDEIYEWVLSLPYSIIDEFNNYIESMPSITLEYDVICPKCGSTDHFVVNNLIDFFTYDTQTTM